VLCTDKTGTLTVDEVTLLKSLDVDGRDSEEVLKLAYANSHFQVSRTLYLVACNSLEWSSD
jgi:Mg2+-importing ATPase